MKRFALATIIALPLALRAQQAERATFYVLLNADTLTVERTERTPDQLVVQLFNVRQRNRVVVEAALTGEALVRRATLSVYAGEKDTTPQLRSVARFEGDSIGVDRNGVVNWIHGMSGALPNLNPSGAFLEQSLMRARRLHADSVTLQWFSVPYGPAIPATITFVGKDSALVRAGVATVHVAVDATGRLLGGYVPSQNVRFLRGPATSGAIGPTKSYPAPPGAPYTAQDVTFRTRAGLTFNATLTLPLEGSQRPVPAVITISGSGPEDRNGTPPAIPQWRPFYQIADTLGRRGIAVLRIDDRGLGSDAGPATATTADFADDIRDAVAYLRTRKEIDPRRIALIGHSEGGSIAPMVAASDSLLKAIVIMAGTVSPGRDIVAWQQQFVIDSMDHFVGQQRELAMTQSRQALDSMAAALPWMKFFLAYDGTATAAKVRQPVLILHGEKDYQVPVAEAQKVAAAIRSGGNRDVTIRTFPATNHLFLGDAGVGFSYEKLPSYEVKPDILGALAEWLVARLTR